MTWDAAETGGRHSGGSSPGADFASSPLALSSSPLIASRRTDGKGGEKRGTIDASDDVREGTRQFETTIEKFEHRLSKIDDSKFVIVDDDNDGDGDDGNHRGGADSDLCSAGKRGS
jgi:hypothetical protein